MNDYDLQAYQTLVHYQDKIKSKRISKVSYLLKLKTQSHSIANLDRKHKAWGKNALILK